MTGQVRGGAATAPVVIGFQGACFGVQAEVLELRSLVEGLTRKNRHLTEELAEANRAHDATHTQLISLQVIFRGTMRPDACQGWLQYAPCLTSGGRCQGFWQL